jgi:protein TonB
MDRHSTVSPFGALLDELREARVYDPAPARRPRPRAIVPRPPRPEGVPEPELVLESGVVSGGRARAARSWRWAPALALHGAGLVALVVVPVFLAEELPAPAIGVSNVLFVPAAVAPPPPPPPAARRRAEPAPRRDATSPRTASLAAPSVTSAEVKPEDVIDQAPPAPSVMPVEDGVPGGVEEGVPGGIVGGVIERAAVNESASPSAVRVGGEIKEPRKLKNVAPVYPDVAARGRVEGVVILEIGILPNGRVEDVRVLRGIPLLDAAAVDAARQWVFAPTLYRGVPVSVTMTVSVRFSLTQGASAS